MVHFGGQAHAGGGAHDQRGARRIVAVQQAGNPNLGRLCVLVMFQLHAQYRFDLLAQHDDFQERIRAVRANAGTTPEVRFQVALGPGFVFVTARYFKTWAERDTWQDELAKAYGQPEADRLVNQWRQTLLDTESFVLRHRPELSRVRPPAAPTRP